MGSSWWLKHALAPSGNEEEWSAEAHGIAYLELVPGERGPRSIAVPPKAMEPSGDGGCPCACAERMSNDSSSSVSGATLPGATLDHDEKPFFGG